MIVYLDTSALVKLYVQEEGSETVRKITGEATALSISELGLIETYSALCRKAGDDKITSKNLKRVLHQLEEDWNSIGRISLSSAVFQEAKNLIRDSLLRSYDAIHLASALILSQSLKAKIGFVCFDKKLEKVAGKHRQLQMMK